MEGVMTMDHFMAPDAEWEIEVVCSGALLRDGGGPSHSKRLAYIARLRYWPDSGWTAMRISYKSRSWRAVQGLGDAGEPEHAMRHITRDGHPVDVDAAIESGRSAELLGQGHSKFALRCDVCGIDVQGKATTLAPRLDMLRAAGLASVELPALDAIMSRSNTD